MPFLTLAGTGEGSAEVVPAARREDPVRHVQGLPENLGQRQT